MNQNENAAVSGMNQNQKAVMAGLYTLSASIIVAGIVILMTGGRGSNEIGLIPLGIGAVILLSAIVARQQLPKQDMSVPFPK